MNRKTITCIILIPLAIVCYIFSNGIFYATLYLPQYSGWIIGAILGIGCAAMITSCWVRKSNDIGGKPCTFKDYTDEPVHNYRT